MQNDKILIGKNISRTFGTGDTAVNALDDVSIEVNKGELLCLRGRSGSGKTTLINILGTLDIPDKGEVIYNGEDITKYPESRRDVLRRQEMAFVFQSVALMSQMTALENVEFALRLAKYPLRERSKRAKECLVQVGLEKRMNHRPGELSGGECQRVAIARAIAHKPKIIFADEPTAELDLQTGLAVMKLFKSVISEDLSIVMTTHDEMVMELADRIYRLEDGKIT